MKLLVTFGCSWMFGVGVNYELGQTRDEYKINAWNKQIADENSFRGLLSQKYNFVNVNFSKGGSSNQEQFRLAENYFSSIEFISQKQHYSEIVVLWGITSIYRNEIFFNDYHRRKSFMYFESLPICKNILVNHFDQEDEVDLLSKKICFWDRFFDSIGVNNVWVDLFNHHDYKCAPNWLKDNYCECAGKNWPTWEKFSRGNINGIDQAIKDEIFDRQRWEFYKFFYNPTERFYKGDDCPRDLLSQLALKNSIPKLDNSYHQSDWDVDNKNVEYLTNIGVLNPFSNHPTKEGHRQIAKMLEQYFQ